MSTKKFFEFVVEGREVDYALYWVLAYSAREALLRYVSFAEELNFAKMKALEQLDFEYGIELANEFLQDRIVNVHSIEDFWYTSADTYITVIKEPNDEQSE